VSDWTRWRVDVVLAEMADESGPYWEDNGQPWGPVFCFSAAFDPGCHARPQPLAVDGHAYRRRTRRRKP
jgi:hypothetical protein